MTLESLVRIVIETVEKEAALRRLRVGACAFDKNNLEELREYAGSVNGKYRIFEPEGFPEEKAGNACDLLFVDRLPARLLAGLALGVGGDGPAIYMNGMILRGGAVFVLKDGTGITEATPPSRAELLRLYKKMLEKCGFVFLSSGGRDGADALEPAVYGKNVLSRGELLAHARGGVITVGASVVITDLAKDTARDKNITITRI